MALCCPPWRVPCHILNRETFSRSRWRRCRDPQPHIIQGENLNWRPLFGPFLQRLGNPGEEWEETCRRQREWKTTGDNDYQINSYGPHWARRASTWPALICIRSSVSMLRLIDWCFVGRLTVRTENALTLLSAFGTLSSYWVALVILDMRAFFLCYCNDWRLLAPHSFLKK